MLASLAPVSSGRKDLGQALSSILETRKNIDWKSRGRRMLQQGCEPCNPCVNCVEGSRMEGLKGMCTKSEGTATVIL